MYLITVQKLFDSLSDFKMHFQVDTVSEAITLANHDFSLSLYTVVIHIFLLIMRIYNKFTLSFSVGTDQNRNRKHFLLSVQYSFNYVYG